MSGIPVSAKPDQWKYHVVYNDVVWAKDESEARAAALASLQEEDGTLLRVYKCGDQQAKEHDDGLDVIALEWTQ